MFNRTFLTASVLSLALIGTANAGYLDHKRGNDFTIQPLLSAASLSTKPLRQLFLKRSVAIVAVIMSILMSVATTQKPIRSLVPSLAVSLVTRLVVVMAKQQQLLRVHYLAHLLALIIVKPNER